MTRPLAGPTGAPSSQMEAVSKLGPRPQDRLPTSLLDEPSKTVSLVQRIPRWSGRMHFFAHLRSSNQFLGHRRHSLVGLCTWVWHKTIRAGPAFQRQEYNERKGKDQATNVRAGAGEALGGSLGPCHRAKRRERYWTGHPGQCEMLREPLEYCMKPHSGSGGGHGDRDRDRDRDRGAPCQPIGLGLSYSNDGLNSGKLPTTLQS